MIPLSSKISNENGGKTLDVNCENFVTSEKIILILQAEVKILLKFNKICPIQILMKKHLNGIFCQYGVRVENLIASFNRPSIRYRVSNESHASSWDSASRDKQTS